MGLLGALSETPPQQILIGDNVFEEYKGLLRRTMYCSN